VDTGIGRIGPYYDEAPEFIEIGRIRNMRLRDCLPICLRDEKQLYRLQLVRFEHVLSELRKMKIQIPIKHTANSAGVITIHNPIMKWFDRINDLWSLSVRVMNRRLN